jgi:hypothetical protein
VWFRLGVTPDPTDSLEHMTPAELIGLVRRLVGEVTRLRAEVERVNGVAAGLRVENHPLKDEITRLKHLPPRPPHKPCGIQQATDRPEGKASDERGASNRRRGPGVSKLSIERTETLSIEAPAGSRHEGFEDIIVQDLMLKAEATRYRRERWETPDGKRLIAPPPAGIVDGCGPHLIRLGAGACASFSRPDDLREDRGASDRPWLGDLKSARWCGSWPPSSRVSAPRTRRCCGRGWWARPSSPSTTLGHAGKGCFTTRIGSDRFAAFRTGPGKSRLAFLNRLLGGAARYGINAAAIATMHGADLPQEVIDKLAGHSSLAFGSHGEWMSHLRALGFAHLRVTPDPVRATSEAARCGAQTKPRACSARLSSTGRAHGCPARFMRVRPAPR